MTREFCHLHLHTEYSILDGACRVADCLETTKSMGMDSLAITDHGVMYGAISFYRKALELGVKPILGCEVYVARGEATTRNGGMAEQPYHLVLLAQNNQGYENLMKIVTLGFTKGFYYKPRVDKEILRELHQGIIALSACLKGEIPSLIVEENYQEAARKADEYSQIFGEGNFYLELMDHGIEVQPRVNQALAELSKEKGVPLVVTNDVHYVKREESRAHDVLLCIQTGKVINEPKRLRFQGEEFYLKSPEEMEALFPDFPEAIQNTEEIASRCDVEVDFNRVYLPRYTPPDGYDLDSYLEKLARDGLKERYGEVTEEISERLTEELDVIKKLKFSGYFLIVWDFVKYAEEKAIKVGPGRGSAAGSLVAYLLGITSIDPLKYGLLFERFLNPERIALPDIDIDFSHNRRSEVIEYIAAKYGVGRVAQIISFSRLTARAAVKDVGRVMDIPYARMDAISKMVPEDPRMTIEVALKQSSELKEAYETDSEMREIIETAQNLEGLVRHDSVHAAGVVIADDELTRYTPLQRSKSGEDSELVTQYDMYDIEKLGLLKVDLLGLKNQSLLELAISLIKQRRGIDVDIDAVPLDDLQTFKLIQEGKTTGVFQLASPGMRALMREMLPEKFDDIIALIALYRPGPLGMDMHRVFVEQKKGRKKIKYPHPSLEPILKETYGVIVYQEQAIRIAREMAGYTGLEADELRKAMAKKKPEIMMAHKQKFIEGAVSRGIDSASASRVFELIEKFGGYAFNKSHSTAYAYVSYQTAYLKAHYPTEYMAALMTIYMDNPDRLVEYINECKHIGIEVKPPDINKSASHFTPFDDSVLFGLSAVRNVGSSVVERIIQARNEGGEFESFSDFCERAPAAATNKKTLESLIKAGAFDSIQSDRSALLATYDAVADIAQRHKREKEEGQFSLFEDVQETNSPEEIGLPPEYQQVPRKELLKFEKEMLGAYVSGHPLEDWEAQICNQVDMEIAQLTGENSKELVTLGGMISRIAKRYNKLGKPWATFFLEDFSGRIEVLLFTGKFEKYQEFLTEDAIVLVKGKVDQGDNMKRLLAEEIKPLSDAMSGPSCLEIMLEQEKIGEQDITRIKETLIRHPGKIPVHLKLVDGGEKKTMRLGDLYCVEADEKLLDELKSFFGESATRLIYP